MRTAMQSTFDLEKLLENKISEQIEGIVEYSVQEMSDEDFELLGDLDSETLKDKEEGKPTESVPEQRVIEQWNSLTPTEEEQGQLLDFRKF